MRSARTFGFALLLALIAGRGWAQAAAPVEAEQLGTVASGPLPDIPTLLQEVERNQKRVESLQRDYTYHVHTEEQDLEKNGAVKKTETTDAESLTIDGVRVNRVVARNGKPLTPEEQQKESERIDKDVTRAKERRAKLEAKGGASDERGDAVLPVSRILELGSFSNPRRVEQGGRSMLVLDYAGNPEARTHNAFEGVIRDLVGTVWIDEADRVLVRGQGHFLNDFKLGGGLVADLHKGTNFDFRAVRVNDSVWLPASIDGQGSVRVMLFASFHGRMRVTTSDYRRFRTSATILPGNGVIGPDGTPLPDPAAEQNAKHPADP